MPSVNLMNVLTITLFLTFLTASQANIMAEESYDEMVYVTPKMESYYFNIVKPNTNSTLCDLCTFTVQIIRDELKLGNTTIHYIEDVVQILCDIFNQKHTCEIIIDDINYIVDMIERGWTPLDICKVIHLCSDIQHIRTPTWYKRIDTLPHKETYIGYATATKYRLYP